MEENADKKRTWTTTRMLGLVPFQNINVLRYLKYEKMLVLTNQRGIMEVAEFYYE